MLQIFGGHKDSGMPLMGLGVRHQQNLHIIQVQHSVCHYMMYASRIFLHHALNRYHACHVMEHQCTEGHRLRQCCNGC